MTTKSPTANASWKHGESCPKTDEYKIWEGILKRCLSKNCRLYPRYGGRGITVCDEWRYDYSAFLQHMGRRPGAQFSVDRIDNEKGYEPGNVRWATVKEQARNRRSNRLITIDGVTLTIAGWSEKTGIDQDVISSRISRYGWDEVRAVLEPMKTRAEISSIGGRTRWGKL